MSYVSSIELRKVRPEAVNEKSVIESVVGLFHDVVEKVPQAYATSSRTNNSDQLEPIEWVRFLSNVHEWHPSIRIETLVLLIAYKSCLALWTVEINGIASELFSIREHNICSACLLTTNSSLDDPHSSYRPLIAFAKSAGPPSIQIRSLKNDQHMIKVINLPGVGLQAEPILIESNSSVLICATHTFIIGYDIIKFDEKFFLSNVYSSLPLALSTRWLAFADYRLHLIHQSSGGINGNIAEQYASYTGAVLNAAKSLSKSVVKIGESVLGYSGQQMNNSSNFNDKLPVTKQASSPTINNNSNANSSRHRLGSGKDEAQAGIVTIIDTIKLFGSTVHDERQNWIIAHFQAHNESIGYLQFNPSGHLLVTCDTSGHYFNVLEIQTSPYRCTRTFIKHLYTLFRGDTDCRVSHMTFTTDSRWLAVSTKRGTTHLFAINPYGGVVNIRTHSKTYVVNKASRYHRTAGLEEQSVRQSNTNTNDNGLKDTSSNSLTNSSSNTNNNHSNSFTSLARTKRTNPECIFSTAVTIIRQPTDNFVSGLTVPFNMDSLCLAATFGISRGFLNPEDMINHQEHTARACGSLYIISWHGRLIEYVLEPIADTSKHGNRVTPETPLILKTSPKAQWSLQKLTTWPEVRIPVANAFLSQGHRTVSTNKVHSKDDWLRQVEMNACIGPHRRLWMGPQFQFKHYSEATVSICHPNSNVFTADSPQTSMNVVDADLQSLPIKWSKSTPVHVPSLQKDIALAYIEVGSGSYQDAPSLSVYGDSFDSTKSDFEVDLVEKLADAAVDISLKNSGIGDTMDSLTSSSSSSIPTRPSQTNHSLENMIPFPDTGDPTD
ncbi:unnamed protein product [Rotaria magnacalcarata]|uniref:BCAS3 WD40 domain-containing protein n=5 Tax=Rotaria magnacalcarata TaxID=392030 RepID=A0A814X094_9BILA|nr:unnamed protein product [Rotaria magnacalcarata]CAF1610477.1 unnamed protein product [Rotaria magnacalcarata]CAF1920114.1 unnamed protein product [Rotaria magnacalcarata]